MTRPLSRETGIALCPTCDGTGECLKLCRKGLHEMTPENTMARGRCRECRRAWDRGKYRRDLQYKPCGCGCGCGEMTAGTWCAGHNTRMREVDFAANYAVDENGCWIWHAALSGGYGVVRRGGRNHGAHVWSYVTAVGPVPEGLELDHLCRNRACVNPEHLEPVTHAENIRRSTATKLTAVDVLAIRESIERSGLVAPRHGLSKRHVQHIRARKAWRDV